MDNEKSKTIKLVVRLNKQEKEILERCLKYIGSTASEFIRSLIKNKSEKMFPYYKVKGRPIRKLEVELTVEQKCEMIGGRILKNEHGLLVCRTQESKSKFGSSHIDLNLDDSV